MTDRFNRKTFSLYPRYHREQDLTSTRVLEKFSSAQDLEYDKWNLKLDELENALNLSTVSDSDLRYYAYDLGISIPSYFPEATRKAFIGQAPFFYKRKGDHQAIIDAIRTVLNITVTIYAPWADTNNWHIGLDAIGVGTFVGVGEPYRRQNPKVWEIGNNSIGDKSVVGDYRINKALPRTFYVFLPTTLSDEKILTIEWIIFWLKGAEEHARIIIPQYDCLFWVMDDAVLDICTILTNDCWAIGVDLIGISTFICGEGNPVLPPFITDPGDILLPPIDDVVPVDEFFTENCGAGLFPDEDTVPLVAHFQECLEPVYGLFNAVQAPEEGSFDVSELSNLIPIPS